MSKEWVMELRHSKVLVVSRRKKITWFQILDTDKLSMHVLPKTTESESEISNIVKGNVKL